MVADGIRWTMQRLPNAIISMSAVFFAFHFSPIFALGVALATRLFLELTTVLQNTFTFVPNIIALYVMAFSLLYLSKSLIDAFWDFMSFNASPIPRARSSQSAPSVQFAAAAHPGATASPAPEARLNGSHASGTTLQASTPELSAATEDSGCGGGRGRFGLGAREGEGGEGEGAQKSPPATPLPPLLTSPTVASTFINPDTREKLLHYVRWRRRDEVLRRLDSSQFALIIVTSNLTLVFLTLWFMDVLGMDLGCRAAVAVSLSLQLIYTDDMVRRFGLDALVSDIPEPNPEIWNSTVHTLRVVAITCSVVFGLVLSFISNYSYGFLNPFLVCSTGQALHYTLLRFASDILDGWIDISTHCTLLAKASYRISTFVAGLSAFLYFNNLAITTMVVFAIAAFVHASLQLTGSFSTAMRQCVFVSSSWRHQLPTLDSSAEPEETSEERSANRRLRKWIIRKLTAIIGKRKTPSGIPQNPWRLLEFAALTFLLPLLPCGIVTFLALAPQPVVIAFVFLGASLALFFKIPMNVKRMLHHVWLLVSGYALFYDRLARSRERRRQRREMRFEKTTLRRRTMSPADTESEDRDRLLQTSEDDKNTSSNTRLQKSKDDLDGALAPQGRRVASNSSLLQGSPGRQGSILRRRRLYSEGDQPYMDERRSQGREDKSRARQERLNAQRSVTLPSTTGIRFDQRAALGVFSIAVWGLVLLMAGGVFEKALDREVRNPYNIDLDPNSSVPGGNQSFRYSLALFHHSHSIGDAYFTFSEKKVCFCCW